MAKLKRNNDLYANNIKASTAAISGNGKQQQRASGGTIENAGGGHSAVAGPMGLSAMVQGVDEEETGAIDLIHCSENTAGALLLDIQSQEHSSQLSAYSDVSASNGHNGVSVGASTMTAITALRGYQSTSSYVCIEGTVQKAILNGHELKFDHRAFSTYTSALSSSSPSCSSAPSAVRLECRPENNYTEEGIEKFHTLPSPFSCFYVQDASGAVACVAVPPSLLHQWSSVFILGEGQHIQLLALELDASRSAFSQHRAGLSTFLATMYADEGGPGSFSGHFRHNDQNRNSADESSSLARHCRYGHQSYSLSLPHYHPMMCLEVNRRSVFRLSVQQRIHPSPTSTSTSASPLSLAHLEARGCAGMRSGGSSGDGWAEVDWNLQPSSRVPVVSPLYDILYAASSASLSSSSSLLSTSMSCDAATTTDAHLQPRRVNIRCRVTDIEFMDGLCSVKITDPSLSSASLSSSSLPFSSSHVKDVCVSVTSKLDAHHLLLDSFCNPHHSSNGNSGDGGSTTSSGHGVDGGHGVRAVWVLMRDVLVHRTQVSCSVDMEGRDNGDTFGNNNPNNRNINKGHHNVNGSGTMNDSDLFSYTRFNVELTADSFTDFILLSSNGAYGDNENNNNSNRSTDQNHTSGANTTAADTSMRTKSGTLGSDLADNTSVFKYQVQFVEHDTKICIRSQTL